MSTKKIAIIAISVIVFFVTCNSGVSFKNDTVDLKNRFETKSKGELAAFYDGMWKTISQLGQVAVKNDSSFSRNVTTVMEGRKDAPGIMMKWVKETNPNANYEQVTKLYENLGRVIESKRNELFILEKSILGIVLEYNNKIEKVPGSLWNILFGLKPLEYKPITSDRTDEVIKTHKDNDTKVF